MGHPKRILYLFPDRTSELDREWVAGTFWPTYRDAAAKVGMDFGVAPPEHLLIAEREAYWRGERLDPARDIVVHDIRADPAQAADLWSGITAVSALEALGFWTAIPLRAAIIANDKHATAELLRDSPIPVIPSVRVTTGRDTKHLDYQRLVPDDWFPVFVKPASWGRGLGCVRCGDRSTLEAVLGLASGSGATMLVQPAVGRVRADVRVVVVEGEIVAMYDRIPADDSHVANISRGATCAPRTALDAPVAELVAMVHDRLDLPYVCIDLLEAVDGRLWFSELELDGAVSALFDRPDELRRVVGGRFAAYGRRLDRHLAARPEPASAPALH